MSWELINIKYGRSPSGSLSPSHQKLLCFKRFCEIKLNISFLSLSIQRTLELWELQYPLNLKVQSHKWLFKVSLFVNQGDVSRFFGQSKYQRGHALFVNASKAHQLQQGSNYLHLIHVLGKGYLYEQYNNYLSTEILFLPLCWLLYLNLLFPATYLFHSISF